MPWIDDWGESVDLDALALPTARLVAAYLAEAAVGFATIVGAYRNNTGAEILVADLRTGAPQRPVVPIEPVERVGVAFADEGSMPLVLLLRDGFPDTEHQQLVPEGYPAAICIDDRPWDEARLTWTAAELIGRVLTWFRCAARGELHDPHQPLDPFFGVSPWRFVFPASILSEPEGVELVGVLNDAEDPDVVTVLPLASLPKPVKTGRLLPIVYRVPAERMTRMRRAPRDLMGLRDVLAERGVDLLADLRARIARWSGSGREDRARLEASLAIVVAMPVTGPDGRQPGMLDLRVFVTARSIGEVGVAAGVLLRAESDQAASGFTRAVQPLPVDEPALRGCTVDIAQVHHAFDPDRAASLSGREARDSRKAVLVGAGAIGSHLAEYFVREGRFEWVIVDDDRLLPHNLARHTLRSSEVGRLKARALGERLNSLFTETGPTVVTEALGCNILHAGSHSEELAARLAEADLVLDASASVAVSRRLADLGIRARRASAFFNPSAEAAVVLVEAQDRSVGLRDLEAQYYRAVLQTDGLERHLTAIGERFAYTGACRDVTSRVPASRTALLSALAAQGLARALDDAGPFIGIWVLGPEGQVALTKPAVAPAAVRERLIDWEITVDADLKAVLHAMRSAALPSETGGVLIGVIDAIARTVHLVEALPPPPDSVGSPNRFERGVEDLFDAVADKMSRVMGQVRYVGEWHSHPPDHSTEPSLTDLNQLGQTTMDTSIEGFPGISVIVGNSGLNVLAGERRGSGLR